VLDAIARGRCAAEVRAVVSDRSSAKGLERARAANIARAAALVSRHRWAGASHRSRCARERLHVADAGIDTGPIIAQAVVPVVEGDDAERLHQRIQAADHRLLPAVIDAIARGDIALANGVRIAPRCTDESAVLTSLRT
jgi:folate-dependent phosphoribosylglycinamide formyltransferase PurN